MRSYTKNVLFVGLLFAHSLALAAQSTCEEIRAGVDIGSGTTKMVVARVDTCTQTVEAILAPRPGTRLELPVEYKKNIVVTADGRKIFRPEIEEAGLAALAEFKEIALAHGAQKFSAVATTEVLCGRDIRVSPGIGELRGRVHHSNSRAARNPRTRPRAVRRGPPGLPGNDCEARRPSLRTTRLGHRRREHADRVLGRDDAQGGGLRGALREQRHASVRR